ncbi:MAG: helix-turn-helix domain-containing protein [Atopobiaceae bacterium]|nr:helix-turn-helix domain-containing protein [Atopobiaceae bacterium]
MTRKTLGITTREQLDVYMNPQRQRLLHEMQVLAQPATCKQLADAMGISASSVTHHMRKLESLGLVELDHTEVIRGITARYWRAVPTDVSLRANEDGDLQEEKMFLVDYLNQQVFAGLRAYAASDAVEREKELGLAHGELLSGVMHLTEDAAREFQDVVRAFVEKYDQPQEGTVPWEFSVACYPHRSFPA